MKDRNKPKIFPKDQSTTKSTTEPTAKLKGAGTVDRSSALSTEFIIESDDDKDRKSRQSSASGLGVASRTRLTSPTSPSPRTKSSLPVTKATASGNKKLPSPEVTSSISSSSEVEGSTQSSSESESGADTEERGSRGAEKLGTQSKLVQKAQQSIPAYKPPNGFEPAKITLPSSFALSTLLSASGCSDTQLWHITVPATIPIDAIMKTSLSTLLKSEAVLSYKGSDYGFIQDPKRGQDKVYILIPNEKESQYGSIPADVGRTLHLRQLVQLPNFTNTSRKPGDGSKKNSVLPRVYKKFVRQQPEGLRMRYRPFGDTEPDLGEIPTDHSTPDDEEAINAQFQLPAGLEKTQFVGKWISADNGSCEDGHTAKRLRSKNMLESNGNGKVRELRNGVDPSKIAPVEDPQKCTPDGILIKEVSMANGTADDLRDGGMERHSKRTSEERIARKEGKRQRKEQGKIGEIQFEPNGETRRKKRKMHQERVVETT